MNTSDDLRAAYARHLGPNPPYIQPEAIELLSSIMALISNGLPAQDAIAYAIASIAIKAGNLNELVDRYKQKKARLPLPKEAAINSSRKIFNAMMEEV